MIHLTRLNNRMLVVNSDLVKFIENAPDTVITLISGEKIVVLETAEEIIDRIIQFRRRLSEPVTLANDNSDCPANPGSSRPNVPPPDPAAPLDEGK